MFRVAFSFLFLLFFRLESAENLTPRLTAEAEPITTVYGCVNVISGDFFQVNNDITIAGPDPLSLTRMYDSGHPFTSEFGTGFGLDFPLHLTVTLNRKKRSTTWIKDAFLEERQGMSFPYKLYHGHGWIDAKVHPDLFKSSFTNTSGPEISAQTNIENVKMRYSNFTRQNPTGGTWRYENGGGTVRYYVPAKRNKKVFNIQEEIKPNGNRVVYEFDGGDRIKKIRLLNSTKTKELGALSFTHGLTGGVTGSNGLHVQYRVLRKTFRSKMSSTKKKRDILDKVSASHLPDTEHILPKYVNLRSITCPYKEFKRPENRTMKIIYDDEMTETAGRVLAIHEPIGKTSDLLPSYKFGYCIRQRVTVVWDALGNFTFYCFKNRRMDAIEHYSKEEKLLLKRKFFWDSRGKLLAKANCDKGNNILNAKRLYYDGRGNVIQENLFGNLTGKGPKTFKLNNNHLPIGAVESCVTKRTYSNDRFNLLLKEIYPNGTEKQYSYKPNTNLIASVFTVFGGVVQEREFCFYDDCAVLVRKIADDGSSRKIDDLKDVTYRRINHIQPVPYGKPGFGLPQTVTNCYLDLQSGAEVFLNKTVCAYSKEGLLIRQDLYNAYDEFQYSIHKKYNSHLQVVEETDALGHVTHYKYDANDNKTFQRKEGTGKSIYYTYDFMNRLIAEEERNDKGLRLKRSYTYDLLSRKTVSTDWFGKTTHFVYDAMNNLIREIDTLGFADNNAYDPLGNLIINTNKSKHTTYFEYNAYGKPTVISHPNGTQEKMEYLPNGWLAKKIEKNGTYTTYTYDYKGRATETKSYDSSNTFLCSETKKYKGDLLISETDAKGTITRYEYDGAGRKIAKIKDQSKITFAYDGLGRLYKTCVWFGENTSDFTVSIVIHDLLNRVIEKRVEDAEGKILSKETYAYDVQGNKILSRSYTSKNTFSQQEMQYDPQGNLILETDALGYSTHLNYEYGNVLKVTTTNPLGQISQKTYDAMGRVSHEEKRNPYGDKISEKTMAYDRSGKKVRELHTRFQGKEKIGVYRIDWTYNNMGKVIKQTEQPQSPPIKEKQYSYDLMGRLHVLTKPDGVQLIHTYDALGRMLRLTSSEGSVDYSYQYDLNGNLTQAIDQINDQKNIRVYDPLNRLTSEILGNGLTLQYQYDRQGRMQRLQLPDKTAVRWEYDAVNLTSVVRENQQQQEQYRHRYLETDWEGKPLCSRLIKRAGEISYRWDLLGRNVSIATKHWEQTIPPEGFDAAGNLLFLNLKDSLGTTHSDYRYDDLYQIIQEQGIADHTYAHDSLNNRLEKDGKETHLDHHHQVIDDSDHAYTYDKNGNRLTKGPITYHYDALNRLTSVEKPNEFEAQYTYDSFGRRLSKKIYGWEDQSSWWNPWAEEQLEWVLTKEEYYFYQGEREIGAADPNGKITQLKVVGRKKASTLAISIALELNEKVYAPIHDHRGNICTLLDRYGRVVETTRYNAYGEEKREGNVDTPWRFAGKRFDPETELIYFGKRYYDPNLGRWVTPDPAGFVDGPNLYAYVHNNPLTFVDVFGLWTIMTAPQKKDPTITKRYNFEKSYKNKSRLYDLSDEGFKELPQGHMTFINGVWNSIEDARDNAGYVAKLAGGYNVHGVYNANHGKMADVREAAANANFIATTPVLSLHEKWDSYFSNNSNSSPILHTCHSQGVAHTKNALLLYPEKLRKQIIVVAIAPQVIIDRNTCKDVVHYRSSRDPIPWLDQRITKDEIETVTTLKPHKDAPRFDHSFTSPTYQEVIKKHIEEYIQKYGGVR